MKYSEIKTCSPKCKSTQHADDLIGLLTKSSDTQIILSGLLQCWNFHKLQDKLGRHLIHIAASCGRSEVCDWLIKLKKVELNLKTFENGWTPAHCAAFYGMIDSLVVLVRNGANLFKNDFDRLTPVDHLILDKWLCTRNQVSFDDSFDVYSWGSNANFNLGLGHEMKKIIPELVDYFKKSDLNIVEIVMSKFHSVFRSKNGQVYTCGFGIDGRLGHDNEISLVTPKLVELLKNEKCIQIAASRNNSYFLTCEGVLYSCGTNEFKQLGQTGITKALSPRQINTSKLLKGKKITQIACSRFHVVILTSSSEVFTFGLNAGQLGHINEMVGNNSSYNSTVCYINEPRLISALNEPDMDIDIIACSDGSTVCLQRNKNILHLFNDYKSKRLHYYKETGSAFKKIRIYGGKLDHPEVKWIEDLGDPILIVGLTENNLLFIWRENDPVWRNITWNGNKNLKINDFDLNTHGIIFCTIQGMCYKADFIKNKSSKTNQPSTPSNLKDSPEFNKSDKLNLFNSELKTETLDLAPIPFLNRCCSVANDLKARNFFALQYHPNSNIKYYPSQVKSSFKSNMQLFMDEHVIKCTNATSFYQETFQINDVNLKYKNFTFALHKFIILSRCPKFFLKLDLSNAKVDLEPYVTPKFNSNFFEILINYIYTNETRPEYIKNVLKSSKITTENSFIHFLTDFRQAVIDKFDLSELKSSFDSKRYTTILKDLNINSRELDDRFELMSNFFYKLITQIDSAKTKKSLKFTRSSYTELHDCELVCSNSESIKCHKCILIARSEYFRNMFLGSWVESNSARIQLPFDMDLTQIFVDYLYTDDIQIEFIHVNTGSSIKNKNEKEIEILFNLYVLSDQLLVERLKNLCEVKLANLVNLKNVVEIFEFSNDYEADQLKEFCMEFISLNLVTLIESKQLESVCLKLLNDLSRFYRLYFDIVGSRLITPYSNGLDPNKIELIPLDLIYDQKFIDGGLEEELNKKKIVNLNNLIVNSNNLIVDQTKHDENRPALDANREVNNYDLNEEFDDEKESQTIKNNEKWEKVKRKNRRKISEKETPKPQMANSKNSITSIVKSSSQTSIFSPLPILSTSLTLKGTIEPQNEIKTNSNKLLETKEEIFGEKKFGTPNNKLKDEEWPDLSAEDKTPKQLTLKPKKVSPVSSKPVNIKQNEPIKEVKTETTTIKSVAWGGISNLTDSASKLSLQDVMNDELIKLGFSQPKKEIIVEPKPKKYAEKDSNNNKSSKGWNIQQNVTHPVDSFSKIIEMEKKSKEQYDKLKLRPLHLIQMEEKAIQDLLKYYNVDKCFNMKINIELIDELSLNSLAPVWKGSK